MEYIRTPAQAEQNAARKMRELGFFDAVATTGGADGGIDVRASNAVAQVKWRGGVTGRPELQRLFGARGADFSSKLLFFSATGYSQQAHEYAMSSGIALFTYEPTGDLRPENRLASSLVNSANPTSAPPPKPSTISSSWSPSRAATRGDQPIGCAPELVLVIAGFICSIGAGTGFHRLLNPEDGDRWGDDAQSLLFFLAIVAVGCWGGLIFLIRKRIKNWQDK
ncbi:restriction endonuclease [Nocardia aurea]|uniref:restriction endonuclease n=1 Tax=Nocardia aurea TaxID=2144174 RepID=UPI000D688F06|nr:restriction endonuclease [Nocardia aurea]